MTSGHPPRQVPPRRHASTRVSARLQCAALAALMSITVTILERRLRKAFDRQHQLAGAAQDPKQHELEVRWQPNVDDSVIQGQGRRSTAR
jgi:hypothetical protein